MPNLIIQFKSQESLENFALWLCNIGEQNWWDYVEAQGEDGEELITYFDYFGGPTSQFMSDNTIRIR